MAFRQMGSTKGFPSEGGRVCSVIAQGMERKAAGIPPRSVRGTPGCPVFRLFLLVVFFNFIEVHYSLKTFLFLSDFVLRPSLTL